MQPIDTAPRDGTHILCRSDEWEVDPNSAAVSITVDRDFYERGMWQSDRYVCVEHVVAEQPSHWCHLPAVPT